MAGISFKTRRVISVCLTAAALTGVWLITKCLDSQLAHSSYFTGAACLATLLMLVLIGVRRRIPVLSIGSFSTWTQIHIYSGIFATGVYIMHVPSLLAGGKFEFGLSLLFWVVSLSGFYGLYASRMLPKRLSAIRPERRFDRMSWHREQLATVANDLIQGITNSETATVLDGYYQKRLRPFFLGRTPLAYMLVPTGTRRRRLLSGLRELNRYLENDGRETAGQFAFLVRQRDDLDYQYALQLRLRVWLVVHGVFSVMLIAGAIVHAVVAWRFTS